MVGKLGDGTVGTFVRVHYLRQPSHTAVALMRGFKVTVHVLP